MSATEAPTSGESLQAILREVVERLAPIDRTPCSPGEREAAEWLAQRMRAVAGVEVTLEDEDSWGTFPPTATSLGVLSIASALLALSGRRAMGGLCASLAFAGIVDEAHNGPRIVRRLARRRRRTVNLIARLGDGDGEGAGHGDGERAGRGDGEGDSPAPGDGGACKLVVIAHHDAPQSGALFDQTLQRRLYERAPHVISRFKTPLPQWWFGLGGGLSTIAAAITARRGFAAAGLAVGLLGTAAVADIWRNDTVQGANDNLSGVAALVALAHMLSAQPVPGLEVLLVSCGAEETLQDGIRAFMARHREGLDPRCTAFVNLDTVGSPHLVMLEAEGPVWMESYAGPWLRDLIVEHAERLGIALERGFRARASTDSVIPSRAGYPTATLLSMTDWRSPANYHLPSDVPANLDYATVADATRLVFDVAGALPRALARAVRS